MGSLGLELRRWTWRLEVLGSSPILVELFWRARLEFVSWRILCIVASMAERDRQETSRTCTLSILLLRKSGDDTSSPEAGFSLERLLGRAGFFHRTS